MDPLSAIFSSVNVQLARVYRIEATAPWGFHSTHGSNIRFVLVLRGAAVLQTQFRLAPLSLRNGDLFILLDDSNFSFADAVNTRSISCEALEDLRVGNTVRFGGGGIDTTLMAGHFAVNRAEAQAIFKVLPTFLHLRLDEKRGHSFHSVLELLSLETDRPELASQEMINRLCEMLFLHAIRAYASEQDNGYRGWLAGLADPQLGRAIELLHAQLQKNWTVDCLAASVGMSRASFASRFKLIVGQSPLEYLTHWRITRACVLMRETDFKIAKIANDVGYASDSAFTKAFKRVMQATPAEFRGEPGQSLHS
jgi:AraC-like DNA-binding protein